MERYNKYIEKGDEAITRRTAHRYRDTISPIPNTAEGQNLNEIIPDEIANEFEISNMENIAKQATASEFTNDMDEYLHEIILENIKEKSNKPFNSICNLEEMINSKDFFEPMSIPVKKSKGELFLMLLKYSVANSLSVTGMTNLFKLVNTIFDDQILPDSRYLIDKLINPQGNVELHAVCQYCSAYIGRFDELKNVNSCRICGLQLDLTNPNSASFFVLCDPTSQIKDIITEHQNHYESVVKGNSHETNFLKDVYDGREYRKFVNSLPTQERYNYISTIFNTDGASKFKCSQYSIWPLYLMINELPKQIRMSKLITCGLWFNKHKPDMSIFLGTFVDLINRLTRQGIPCIINGEDRLLKLYIVNCCVDSVARAPIQGIKQFNGNYGCSWCLHPGTWCDTALKYTLLERVPADRNHESTINDMMNATPDNPINGIKYPSPLLNLLNFDIISGFVPDYMHCCLEGVAKQITNYHVSLMNNEDIIEIDLKLNRIAAPHQISRLSRPITSRNDWKAREWENYILYYSTLVLLDHLSRNYYHHWLLFVESVYILLQDRISSAELNRANVMLHEFVATTQELFGENAMTYNIHQLLHLSESVLNWGPLWCHSTFSFESANHDLLKAIKCSKGVSTQIIRYTNINHCIRVLQDKSYPYISELIKLYCDDVLSSNVVNYHKTDKIAYFGRSQGVDDALINSLNLTDSAEIYFKIVKDECLYESSCKVKRRSNNSYVLLTDGSFACIDKFIVDDEMSREITICKLLRTRNCFSNYYKALQIIEQIESEPIAINTEDIKTICIFMEIIGVMYILPLPNLLHY